MTTTTTDLPGSVLDASALLALLLDEPGGGVVRAVVEAGAIISTVNYAEVLARLIDAGTEPAKAPIRVAAATAGALRIVPFSEADAIRAAALRRPSRRLGLSLADRACLALAARLGSRAVTADRSWERLRIPGMSIALIR